MSTSIYMIVRVDLTNDEVSEVFNPNSSTNVEDILHHNMENGKTMKSSVLPVNSYTPINSQSLMSDFCFSEPYSSVFQPAGVLIFTSQVKITQETAALPSVMRGELHES